MHYFHKNLPIKNTFDNIFFYNFKIFSEQKPFGNYVSVVMIAHFKTFQRPKFKSCRCHWKFEFYNRNIVSWFRLHLEQLVLFVWGTWSNRIRCLNVTPIPCTLQAVSRFPSSPSKGYNETIITTLKSKS